MMLHNENKNTTSSLEKMTPEYFPSNQTVDICNRIWLLKN